MGSIPIRCVYNLPKKKLNNPTMCAMGVQEKVSRLDSPVWILLNTYLFFFTIQMSDMRCMNHMLP